METKPNTGHIGRKISRIRELKGMKQEALAQAMGVSQQTISSIENSESIDEGKLGEVARALGVSVDGIRAFSEENVINYFNTFQDESIGNFHYQCTFNPLDKLVEAYEENKKLYERLLEAEKDKVRYLERLMEK